MEVRTAVETGEPRIPLSAWFMLAVLFMLSILSFIDRGIVALLVDPIKLQFNVDDIHVSYLQGVVFVAAYAALNLPMGWLADRYSRHWVIWAGVTLWSLATAACGIAASFGMLLVARLLVGLGEATLSPAAIAMIVERFPRRRLTLALSILHVGTSMGSAAAFLIGGFLVQWTLQNGPVTFGGHLLQPWQQVFVAIGLPGLAFACLIFLVPGRVVRKVPNASESSPPGFWTWLRKHGAYLASITGGHGFVGACHFAMLAWLPALFARRYGLDPKTTGVTLGLIYAVCASFGHIGGGWLVDRLSNAGVRNVHLRYVVLTSTALGLIGSMGFLLADSAYVTFVVVSALLCLTTVNGPLLAHIQIRTPVVYRSRVVAIANAFTISVAMSLGPTLVAVFTEKLFGAPDKLPYAFALTFIVFGTLAVALFLLAGRLAPSEAE